MSPEVLQTLKDIALPVLTAAGTWAGLRLSGRKNKTDAAQALFNEVQEERTLLRERLDRMERESRAEVAAVRAEVVVLQRENLLLKDFVQDLRNDIRLGAKPPPRDWPEGLRHG